MAKEGFDWIWCDHALTVGYRSSLTEIVQIIGRATRDAPGKTRPRFTNLIAEPDASEEAVAEAVNDTLKAIAASLLMKQVLAPRFQLPAEDARTAFRSRASTMAKRATTPRSATSDSITKRDSSMSRSRDSRCRRERRPSGSATKT